MCQSKVWKKCWEFQRVEQLIWMCCSGMHPLLSEEELEADFSPDSDMLLNSASAPISKLHSSSKSEFISTFNSDIVCLGLEGALAEEDHLLYVYLPPEAEDICASATTSQRLAEAEIPEYL